MATTSLWHIEGRLKDLISYVENPEKTRAENSNLQPLWDVFSYVSRPEATEQGEYISAVNCLKEIALQQMILTKKQYGKENGYIAWHGYQSFKPDEVAPEQAHQIGLQTAKEMWGEKYQIIVTTHLDKDHLHNHFCFNSVSFLDGKKYNYSKSEQRKHREVSDRICREHGLSVIEKPHKAPSRQVWLDEKSGKPTRYNVYREDVKEAINFSRRPYYMEEYLRRKGYSGKARENMETVKRSSNNVIEFLQSEGYIRFRADSEASSKAIYEAYTRWCDDNAQKPMSANRVSSELAQNERLYNVEATNNVHVGGKRVRGFVGIEVANPPPY